MLNPRKDRFDRIIVGMGNRIEFVVMASSTSHGQSHECTGRCADHIVQFVGPLLSGQAGIGALHAVVGTRHQKAGRFVDPHAITSKLFKQEFVEGFVFVDGSNDIVAIGPGIGAWLIRFKSIAFGKFDDIQPMPTPALAEMGRREQSVDQSFAGVGTRIVQELPKLVGRGGKTEQIECRPADECRTICFDRGTKVV